MKKSTIVLFFALSGVAANAHEIANCQEINIDNYQNVLVDRNASSIISPFDNKECLPISFKTKDNSFMSKSDFDNKDQVYKIYEAFLKDTDMSLTVVKDHNDGKVYKFMKFVTDDYQTNKIKKYFNSLNIIYSHADEFLFLHELMHLDAITENSKVTRQEKEASSDVAAVFMISSKHNFTLEQTKELLDDVESFRRKGKVRGFKNELGKRIKDPEHYGEDTKIIFGNVYEYLDRLKKDNKNIMINSFKEARDISHKMLI